VANTPRTGRPHLLGGALAVLALAFLPGVACAQDMLRWAVSGPTGSKPIALYADNINTWTDQGRHIFLVRGKVWITQDLVKITFQEGVLWVADGPKGPDGRAGPYDIKVYAEGDLHVEEAGRSERADRGLLSLSTRGELHLKATSGTPSETAAPADPLFQRAQAALAGVGGQPAGASGVQTAGYQQAPSWSPSPGGLQQVSASDAPSPPPAGVSADQVPAPAATPPNQANPAPAGQAPGKQRTPGKLTQQTSPPAARPSLGNRQIMVRQRSAGQELQIRSFALPSGETAVVISSGVILNVSSAGDSLGAIDIEADQMTFWTRGNTQQVLSDLRSGQGQKHDTLEFYLAGNVEIRSRGPKEVRLLRCDEAYYDVNRHVAVALKGHLEITDPRVKYPLTISAPELIQQNEDLFEAHHADVSASALPYDPGLKLTTSEATLENREIQRRTIFGLPIIDLKTGQPATETERYFTGDNVFVDLEGIPIFYSPVLKGDAEHPLGPLETVGINYNTIFGLQVFTTWNMYDLIGITKIPDTNWRLDLDYLSLRGPAIGSVFDFATKDFLGIPGRYYGLIKGYGIYDTGSDVLGASSGDMVLVSNPPTGPVYDDLQHPNFRGRFLEQFNGYDLPNGFMFQSQISVLSDPFFLPQYYLNEYQTGYNQESFLYVKQQQDFAAWTALVEPNIRNFITETEWLPKVEGDLLGISLLDTFTYNLKSSAGYARLIPTDEPPFAYLPTDKTTNTGRLDLWQDVSLPLTLGAFKVVPYANFDLTYYSEDLAGNQVGRVYGGGGVRASIPFSHLYPDVHSELFNVNGIYHKITLTGNFYEAFSSIPFSDLPQLDRLNDDISDQTLRDIFPQQSILNPGNATLLTTSPMFNPQILALQKLVFDEVDTRDNMEVAQFDLYQRWQTKRGDPGNQHVVDWMTLDLSASVFPRRDRDNFGNYVSFMEYDWIWNIGDRTSLVSSGWMDPVYGGPHVFNIGGNLNRPNNTSFYLGYRQIDPLLSKAVIASATFAFSPKYSVTANTVADFGVHETSYTVLFTRIGTDVQVSFGFSYNSYLNTFGVQFEMLPNLIADKVHAGIGSTGLVTPGTSVGR
jgi:hypothetical protein